jgi:hypothetical protein
MPISSGKREPAKHGVLDTSNEGMEASVRVLIVEDDDTFCAFLAEILQGPGQ